MAPLGKGLLIAGIMLAILGLLMWGLASIAYVGRLPGDFQIQRANFSFYFPLTTCILISIIASIVFSLLFRR